MINLLLILIGVGLVCLALLIKSMVDPFLSENERMKDEKWIRIPLVIVISAIAVAIFFKLLSA